MLMLEFFDKRLAFVHAVCNTGAACTPLIFGLLGVGIFEGLGWKQAMLGLAAIDGGVLAVAGFLLSSPAHQAAQLALSEAKARALTNDGVAPSKSAVAAASSASMREVLAGKRFQILCCAVFLFGPKPL
jgi:hypothetical protein